MALEDLTGTKYIDSLNSSNPAAGDNVSEGDDHIRGIKNILKTTFPGLDGAVNATDTELNLIDGGTARGTDALASGDGILINDAGVMKMTDVDTVQTFMQTGITTDLSGDSSPQLGGFLDANGNYMQTEKGGDIASASPTVIDTDGDYFDVTGTTGFSAFTVAADRQFTLQFDGALTMTHHATNLDLPGEANITTAAGDVATFQSTAANQVQCINYTKADGTSVVAAAGGASVMNELTDVIMDIANFTDGLLIQTDSDGSAPTTGTLSSAGNNIGIGKAVFTALTEGDHNVSIGANTMDALTTGTYNVALGSHAPLGALTTGHRNIAIGGGSCLAITDNIDNIGIGIDTLTAVVSGGDKNVAIGSYAGNNITSGDTNTLIGYQAGDNITTGSNNIVIGNACDAPTATADDQINIANHFKAISTGVIQLRPDGENQNTMEYYANRSLYMWLDPNNWGIMMWDGASTGANYFMGFRTQSNTQIGHIGGNSSNVTYNTSSDYRLKENLDYDWDGTTRLKQLKPVRFNWISDETNTLQDGFIAHEVEDIVPVAITGEKDAMEPEVLFKEGDAETQNIYYKSSDQEVIDGTKNIGDIKVAAPSNVGDVRYAETIKPQVIDPSKIVSLLVKTVQELEARITALES